MPLGTISHVKRSAAHTAMLILNGGLSRPAPRICRMLSSQSHPKGTGLREPESRGPRKFCAAVPEGWLHNGDLYLSCESSGESVVISSCSLLRFHWQKTKSTFVGSHAALSSQRGPSHVKLHFIVSVEHVSPSERKGYFLHHPPLTTTSARFYHVLEREDEAKKKKKAEQPAEKPLLTLAQRLNPKCSCPGLLRGSSVVKPLPQLWFTGRNGVGSPLTHRYQVVCWRWRWELRSMISQTTLWTLASDKRNKTVTAFLNDHSITVPTLWSSQLEMTPRFKLPPKERKTEHEITQSINARTKLQFRRGKALSRNLYLKTVEMKCTQNIKHRAWLSVGIQNFFLLLGKKENVLVNWWFYHTAGPFISRNLYLHRW